MRMISAGFLLATVLLAACADNPVGANKGQCETTPELCSSVREAYTKSDGPVSPPPSNAAIQRGDVMRVWLAPMRVRSGVLTNSGIVYLE
jgi:hypothetical protein